MLDFAAGLLSPPQNLLCLAFVNVRRPQITQDVVPVLMVFPWLVPGTT